MKVSFDLFIATSLYPTIKKRLVSDRQITKPAFVVGKPTLLTRQNKQIKFLRFESL